MYFLLKENGKALLAGIKATDQSWTNVSSRALEFQTAREAYEFARPFHDLQDCRVISSFSPRMRNIRLFA
jgi:hypothetical protein